MMIDCKLGSVLFLLWLMMLAGCRTSKVALENEAATPEVSYSIIYMIHGDSNYLYHDAQGNALQADIHALKEAKEVARKAVHGEVFIFHQKPERKILWVFPKKDRDFTYYRHGKLVHQQHYSPHSDTRSFVTEAKLYKKYHHSTDQDTSYKKIFLYLGHQIPASERTYHLSRPAARFTTQTFASGLQSFLQGRDDAFDLTVLSTCNNGTPLMIDAITPYTSYVLASPQNLHLSHIDSTPLTVLEKSPHVSTATLADTLATHTFRRLSSFLQTVVTLAIYNTDVTHSYLPSFNRAYKKYLAHQPHTLIAPENEDCAHFPFFNEGQYQKGIKLWYKAPRFGQKKDAASYSGWGCREKQKESAKELN